MLINLWGFPNQHPYILQYGYHNSSILDNIGHQRVLKLFQIKGATSALIFTFLGCKTNPN
jgi:hypothetical protein